MGGIVTKFSTIEFNARLIITKKQNLKAFDMECNSENLLANEEMEKGDQEQETIDLDKMNNAFSKETPCSVSHVRK